MTITNVNQVPEQATQTGDMNSDVRYEGSTPMLGGTGSIPDHGPMSGPIGSVDLMSPDLMPGTMQQSADLESEGNEVGAIPALGT